MYDYLIHQPTYIGTIETCENCLASLKWEKEILTENVAKLQAENEGETVTSFGNTMKGFLENGVYANAYAKMEKMQTILEEELPRVNTLIKYINDIGRQLEYAYYSVPVQTGAEYVPQGNGKLALNEANGNAVLEKCRRISEINEEIRLWFHSVLDSLEDYLPEAGTLQGGLTGGCNKVNRIENLEKAVERYMADVKELSNDLKYRLTGLLENANDVRMQSNTYPPEKKGEESLLTQEELLALAEKAKENPESMEKFLEEVVNKGGCYSQSLMERIAESIFGTYEGETLQEKIEEALRLKGEEAGTDYERIYGYLSGSIEGSPYEGEYTQTQLYQIAMHFVLAEPEVGNEMPKWWMESYLKLPEYLQVTEANVADMWGDAKLEEYYIRSYLVLDMISGMGNAQDDKLIGSDKCSSEWVLKQLDKGNISKLYGTWYDYNYGAMYDYMMDKGSVRGVKYMLAVKCGFPADYDNTGNYSVFTNTETELSRLMENAYLTKYGHREEYYNRFLGATSDSHKQLYRYLGQEKEIVPLTEEEQAFLNRAAGVEYKGEVLTCYKDIETLAETLEENMTYFGSDLEVKAEGNKLIIRMGGTSDSVTWEEIEDREHVIEFEGEMMFGATYISVQEYMEKMVEISELRVKGDWYGTIQKEELEEKAYNLMVSQLGSEVVEGFSETEYHEVLESYMIITDMSELLYAGYQTESRREIEKINQVKDVALASFSLLVIATAIVLPPTSPLVAALGVTEGGLAIADGALRMSQGDELSGAIEIVSGGMGIGGMLYKPKSSGSIMSGADDKLDDSLDDAAEGIYKISNGMSGGNAYQGGSDVLDEIKRIDEIEVEFNYNSKYDETEFARQLADQQKGMNELTVQEYLDNRQKYIEQGRAIESNAAQQAAREKAFVDKVDELQDAGLSLKEAEEQAQKWLDTQAALHNPDQVAGGYASNVGGVGDKGVNSSIGSQWRYRIDDVDAQIQRMAESMSEAEKESTYLNVNLIYKGD